MQYWVLKGRPGENDWNSMLQQGLMDDWRTKRPPSSWQVADRFFCWESSPNLRIVGLAELTNPRVEVKRDGNTIFQIRYLTGALTSRPTIEELRQIPVLNEASFLKGGPAATVLRLKAEQAELLLNLIYSRNPNLKLVWPDVKLTYFNPSLPDLDLQTAAREGDKKLLSHLIRERDRQLVERKKRRTLTTSGRLSCEVCSFDFAEVYGQRGQAFCEVHHLQPLSERERATETQLDDLAIVCSNCHRMLHRNPWMTIQQLKQSLGNASTSSSKSHRKVTE